MHPIRHVDRPRPALRAPLALALTAAALAGCGNKGDLYLVEPEPEAMPAQALPGLGLPVDPSTDDPDAPRRARDGAGPSR